MQEKLILESDNHQLRLTDKRVLFEVEQRGASAYTSIPLQKVSAVSFQTKASPILLAIGLICLVIAGLVGTGKYSATPESNQLNGAIFLILSVGFIVAYFVRRYGVLEVISDAGERITFKTAGLSHQQVRKFAEAVAEQIARP